MKIKSYILLYLKPTINHNMTSILIISKYGIIKPLMVKHYDDVNLYKKAGFKSPVNFDCQTIWNITTDENKKYSIFLYAKKSGKAGQENVYNFPPPVDSTLFFGSCVLVSKNENNVAVSLTSSEWEKIYNLLNGGFHDLGETEKDDEDEEEEVEEEEEGEKTKNGYLKDGFVVDDHENNDDEEDEEDEDEEDEEEEDEEEVNNKKKKKEVKKSSESKKEKLNVIESKPKDKDKKKNEKVLVKNENSKRKKKVINNTPLNENIYLNCKTELTFEEYI